MNMNVMKSFVLSTLLATVSIVISLTLAYFADVLFDLGLGDVN